MPSWKNQLFFGDNLEILREHIPVNSVDLIYLDPPFNSKATYNGSLEGEIASRQGTSLQSNPA